MSIRVTQKVWKPTANYGWTVSPVVYCNPSTCPGPAEVSGCNERCYKVPARSSSRETWTFLLQEYIWKIRVWLLSPVIVKISCYWRNTIYWATLVNFNESFEKRWITIKAAKASPYRYERDNLLDMTLNWHKYESYSQSTTGFVVIAN